MDYLSVAEARERDGLRVVLSAGVPVPWGEALKSVLAHKDVPYLAVAQAAGAENPELVEWTGQPAAPVCIFNDEPPRISWLDQLVLIERIAPQRPLLPREPDARVTVVGLCREVAGEFGLGWQRRLELLGPVLHSGEADEQMLRIADRYGWSDTAFEESRRSGLDLLRFFHGRVMAQARVRSDYLVGRDLTAADLYLAHFIGMFRPLPTQQSPMPEHMRAAYETTTPEQRALLEDGLVDYRDRIIRRHVITPLDF